MLQGHALTFIKVRAALDALKTGAATTDLYGDFLAALTFDGNFTPVTTDLAYRTLHFLSVNGSCQR